MKSQTFLGCGPYCKNMNRQRAGPKDLEVFKFFIPEPVVYKSNKILLYSIHQIKYALIHVYDTSCYSINEMDEIV